MRLHPERNTLLNPKTNKTKHSKTIRKEPVVRASNHLKPMPKKWYRISVRDTISIISCQCCPPCCLGLYVWYPKSLLPFRFVRPNNALHLSWCLVFLIHSTRRPKVGNKIFRHQPETSQWHEFESIDIWIVRKTNSRSCPPTWPLVTHLGFTICSCKFSYVRVCLHTLNVDARW